MTGTRVSRNAINALEAARDPAADNPVATAKDLYAFVGGTGPTLTQEELLKAWVNGGAFQFLVPTYHGTYTDLIIGGTVQWPDGSAGTFTATSVNATWRLVDAFTVSHTDSGLTVTQAAVTRSADGQITTQPALTVA